MQKVLAKGNEALAKAAIMGGCTHYFGYPITPQNEIPEYIARELPHHGGVFLQAESELASIHMVYGAAAAGARVMTSSSSPGIALMQEGLSIIAAAELPCVIVNVQRAGPGIGGIQPSQSDYFQMTRGGGNGGYRIPSFAPMTIQESVDMVQDAFEVADRYRTPVFIVSDGLLGQMMEPVEFSGKHRKKQATKDWSLTGTADERSPNLIKTLYLDPEAMESHNGLLQQKYAEMEHALTSWEATRIDAAEVILVAYGSMARIVHNALELLGSMDIRAGMIRPRTLWPFPSAPFAALPPSCERVVCVEMSDGQMVDDVRIAVQGRVEVDFFGRSGGLIPSQAEIATHVHQLLGRGKGT